MKKQLISILLVLVTCLFASASNAQSAPNTGAVTTPSGTTLPLGSSAASAPDIDWSAGMQTDVSIGLLQSILGNWNSSTAPDPVISTLFKTWNLGILIAASFVFIGLAAAGTLSIAEDPDALGKKWGAWVPIRLIFGIAMLMPLANGFCGAQMLIFKLAEWGVGFANYTAQSVTGAYLSQQGSVLTAQLIDAKSLSKTMAGILQAEVCVAEKNFELVDKNSTNSAPLYGGPYIEKGLNTSVSSYTTIYWGPVALSTPGTPVPPLVEGASADQCGRITIPSFNSVAGVGNSSGSSVSASVIQSISNGWSGANLNTANTALRNAHGAAIYKAALALRPAAVQFVNFTGGGNNVVNTAGQLNLAAQVSVVAFQYQQQLAAIMNRPGMIPSTQEMGTIMQNAINQEGWSTLGAWFFQLNRIQSTLSAMTSYSPQFEMREQDEGTLQMLQAVQAALAQSAANPATVAQIQSNGHFSAGNSNGGVAGAVQTGSNIVTNNVTQYVGEMLGVDASNPKPAILQIASSGNNIIDAAEVLFLAKLAVDTAKTVAAPELGAVEGVAAVTEEAAGGGGGIKGFLGKIAGLFSDGSSGGLAHYLALFAAISILTLGATMAFVVPMTPFVIYTGAVIGWVVSVLEGAVASALWIATNLHPEGDGVVARHAAAGFSLVLEIFFKPVLLTISFFVAFKASDAVLRWASQLFFNSMATVSGQSVTGIVTTIAFVSLYVLFTLSLTMRTFSLITVISSAVLRWVGGQGDRFSGTADIAQELENKLSSGFKSAEQPLKEAGRANVARKILKATGTRKKLPDDRLGNDGATE